jgi:hypothetical protein
VLLEHRFDEEGAWQGIVAEHSGIATRLIGNTTAFAATPASGDDVGRLSYRLSAPAGRFERGLDLELSGRAFVHQRLDPRVQIRILAGADAHELREIARIHDADDINHVHRVSLRDIARGREQILVQIELAAPGLPAELLSWCAVYHVRFTTPWPAELLDATLPQDRSLATRRMQHLVTGWRRDAELAMAQLNAERDAELLALAREQYVRGGYVEAYRIAALRTATTRPVSPRSEDRQ